MWGGGDGGWSTAPGVERRAGYQLARIVPAGFVVIGSGCRVGHFRWHQCDRAPISTVSSCLYWRDRCLEAHL